MSPCYDDGMTYTKLAENWPHCVICGAEKAKFISSDGLRTCYVHYLDAPEEGEPPRTPRRSWKTGKPLGEGAA